MREHIMAAAHGVVSFLREGKVGPPESARPGAAADLPNEMTETRTRKERP